MSMVRCQNDTDKIPAGLCGTSQTMSSRRFMDFHFGTRPISGSIVGCVSFNGFETNLEHL